MWEIQPLWGRDSSKLLTLLRAGKSFSYFLSFLPMSLVSQTIATRNPLNEDERAIAEKPTHALIQVTDVGDGPTEFDALSTIIARHLRPLQDQIFRMSEPGILRYAADFASQLPAMARDRIDRARNTTQQNRREIPSDVLEAENAWDQKTLRWVNNYNPRNQKRSEHKNGRTYHLAFSNGVEIAAVPAESLQYLRSRDAIDSLFRVPVENHPLVPKGEQFTSSVFGKTAHEAPEHLQLVWRRGMNTYLLDETVPNLKAPEVAFVDQPYNNRRVITPDLSRTLEDLDAAAQIDGSVIVQVGSTRLRAYRATSLADVPEGEWGVWHNPADEDAEGVGYIELSRRWEVDMDWKGGGQFPSYYLRAEDRHIGASVNVLPKDSKIDAMSFWQSLLAKLRRKAA